MSVLGAGLVGVSEPRKRPAPAGGVALDQLPYQRKACFRRRAHVSLEDALHRFVDSNGSARSAAGGAVPGSSLLLTVALGRLVGKGNDLDVVLPIASEALLEGQGHDFSPALPPESFAALAARLEEERSSWQRTLTSARRWADVSVVQRASPAPLEPRATMTMYCPAGKFHYQLRIRNADSSPNPASTGLMREVVYTFAKDANAEGMWWSVALRGDPVATDSALSVELSLNPRLLWGQHMRMRAGQRHAFSIAIRDLLRNARSLLAFLRGARPVEWSQATRCYYPGLLDSSSDVKQFYSERAQVNTPPPKTGSGVTSAALSRSVEQTQKIRKYNNLVKVLQIEEFVDCMPSPLRVLDLGCGRGQDLYKWAREFRTVLVKSYVGIDFAEEAVEEARRRYETRKRQARHAAVGGGEEYSAVFHCGDLRDAAVFERLPADGHAQFDVISMQFVLNYIASSEACMRDLFTRIHGLLRPGGRVLASIANSDALGECFARGMEASRAAPSVSDAAAEVGNSLYRLCFQHEVWRRVDINDEAAFEEAFSRRWGYPYLFSLVGAVGSQEEYNVPWEAFEELVTGLGFRVLLDGRFPEVHSAYVERSRYHRTVFSQDPSCRTPLSQEEEELFGLYSAFVLERV
mmetsp:Transcript_101463/g.293512  ORF Transcript_101463/g.293512 Transcript_101463/m.293512 type:complete len:634 (-) Transcript_101463:73-1974(-)